MFSRRLQWPYPANRLSRLLEEKRARGASVLDLTESNPTRVGLRYPEEAIAEALRAAAAPAYDPAPRGLEEARAAVAAWHVSRRGLVVDPDRIVLTASTSEAYSYLFKLLADPGDAILVPRPSYPLFDYLAALDGLRVEGYALHDDGDRWSLDFTGLEPGRREGPGGEPRAVVLVNPNNPTGSALRGADRIRLQETASRSGTAIISDEVFLDFLDEPERAGPGRAKGERIVSLLSPDGGAGGEPPLQFALGGLSKACGLPQLKLGWIVVDGPEAAVGEALDRLDLIADTYLSVGTPVQRAAARLLEIGDSIRALIQARLRQNLEALRGTVAKVPSCRLLRRDGGWYAVIQIPAVVPEEERVVSLLAEDDVLVHPGFFFDFPKEAYLVLSLLPEPEAFREAIRRLLARVGH